MIEHYLENSVFLDTHNLLQLIPHPIVDYTLLCIHLPRLILAFMDYVPCILAAIIALPLFLLHLDASDALFSSFKIYLKFTNKNKINKNIFIYNYSKKTF